MNDLSHFYNFTIIFGQGNCLTAAIASLTLSSSQKDKYRNDNENKQVCNNSKSKSWEVVS